MNVYRLLISILVAVGNRAMVRGDTVITVAINSRIETPFCNLFQTKGYNKDSSIKIEDVESLVQDAGKAVYVKICKAGGRKLSKFVLLLSLCFNLSAKLLSVVNEPLT